MLTAALLLNAVCLALVLVAVRRDTVLVDEEGRPAVGPWRTHRVGAVVPTEEPSGR